MTTPDRQTDRQRDRKTETTIKRVELGFVREYSRVFFTYKSSSRNYVSVVESKIDNARETERQRETIIIKSPLQTTPLGSAQKPNYSARPPTPLDRTTVRL